MAEQERKGRIFENLERVRKEGGSSISLGRLGTVLGVFLSLTKGWRIVFPSPGIIFYARTGSLKKTIIASEG